MIVLSNLIFALIDNSDACSGGGDLLPQQSIEQPFDAFVFVHQL